MSELISRQKVMSRLEDFCDWCKDGRLQGAEFVLDCVIPNIPSEPVGNSEQLDRTCAKCKFYTTDGICVQWSRYGFREADYCSRWEGRA